MVLKIIIVIIFSVVAAFIINTIEEVRKNNVDKISFKESIDLTNLPVITFYQDGVKLNFLFDTGATLSVINEKVINSIKVTKSDKVSQTSGIDGEIIDNIPNVQITFNYKDKSFTDDFQVIDMTKIFTSIKETTGVTVHGLIGSVFMQKYKYVLDFKEMIAYSKK